MKEKQEQRMKIKQNVLFARRYISLFMLGSGGKVVFVFHGQLWMEGKRKSEGEEEKKDEGSYVCGRYLA